MSDRKETRRFFPYIQALLFVCLLLAGFGCSSSSDNDDNSPDGDRETEQPDGDSDTTSSVNKTGVACSGDPCPENNNFCLYPNPSVCDGFCRVIGGQSAGICSGNCSAGSGCPEGTYCLACPKRPQLENYCVNESERWWFDPLCGIEAEGDGDMEQEAETDTLPDGDTDGDEDTEPDAPPIPRCESDDDCDEGEHCDLVMHHCGTECNPYTPDCTDDQVCHVIVDGPLAGTGIGVCVDQIAYGKDVNELCVGGQLCKRDLVCFLSDHCTSLCDPNAEDSGCSGSKLCYDDPTSGVGVCSRCSDVVACPGENEICNDDGVCEEQVPCDTWQDCTLPETCIGGFCQGGCQVAGCSAGICNRETGYCDIPCLPACEEGECCNGGQCGPCCDPPCMGLDICVYDLACEAPDERAPLPDGDLPLVDGDQDPDVEIEAETDGDPDAEVSDIAEESDMAEADEESAEAPPDGDESEADLAEIDPDMEADLVDTVDPDVEADTSADGDLEPEIDSTPDGDTEIDGGDTPLPGPCCLPRPDCRNDPDMCEEDQVCDQTTGQCHGVCPAEGCQWQYYCSDLTNYECVPLPPEECLWPFPCTDPCMFCHFDLAYCVPSINCTQDACVPEGVVCAQGADQTPCCQGLSCQAQTGGYYTCEPQ